MRLTAIVAIAISASSAAGDNAKSAKSTSGASAGISQTSVGILPQLEGSYLGNFSYQVSRSKVLIVIVIGPAEHSLTFHSSGLMQQQIP